MQTGDGSASRNRSQTSVGPPALAAASRAARSVRWRHEHRVAGVPVQSHENQRRRTGDRHEDRQPSARRSVSGPSSSRSSRDRTSGRDRRPRPCHPLHGRDPRRNPARRCPIGASSRHNKLISQKQWREAEYRDRRRDRCYELPASVPPSRRAAHPERIHHHHCIPDEVLCLHDVGEAARVELLTPASRAAPPPALARNVLSGYRSKTLRSSPTRPMAPLLLWPKGAARHRARCG
jgi:hypothetical protein